MESHKEHTYTSFARIDGFTYRISPNKLQEVFGPKLEEYKLEANHPKEMSLCIDRPKAIIEALLEYCITDTLHIPKTVCIGAFIEELKFWDISPQRLEDCCYRHYRKYVQTQANMSDFHKMSQDTDKEKNCYMAENRHMKAKLWNILDKRNDTKAAKLYSVVSTGIVLLTIVNITLSTLTPKPKIDGTVQNTTNAQGIPRNDDAKSSIENTTSLIQIQSSASSFKMQSQSIEFPCFPGIEIDPWVYDGDVPPDLPTKHANLGTTLPPSSTYMMKTPQDGYQILEFKHSSSGLSSDITAPPHPEKTFPDYLSSSQQTTLSLLSTITRLKDTHKLTTGSTKSQEMSLASSFPLPDFEAFALSGSSLSENSDSNFITSSVLSHPIEVSFDNVHVSSAVPSVDKLSLSAFSNTISPTYSLNNVNITMNSLANSSLNDGPKADEMFALIKSNDSHIVSLRNLTDIVSDFLQEVGDELSETVQNIVGKQQSISTFSWAGELVIEMFATSFFTIELVMRLITCPDMKSYFKRFLNLLDVLLLASSHVRFILLAVNYWRNINDINDNLEILLFVQIFRVFRLFRIIENVRAFKVLMFSLQKGKKDLSVLLMYIAVGMAIYGNFIYFVEKIEDFPTIPAAFYWSIITMTTVGYGDMYPKTAMGKVISCMCALSGMLAFSLIIPVFVNTFLTVYEYADSLKDIRGKTKYKNEETKRQIPHIIIDESPTTVHTSLKYKETYL